MNEAKGVAAIGMHGASRLPSVEVNSYNIELKDEDGFLGDRASKTAFNEILERLRKLARKEGEDPLGEVPSEEIGKSDLADALTGEDIDAAALVHGAIEDFASELSYVIQRILKTKAWADTEQIIIGGGFRRGRAGELAIARAGHLLANKDIRLKLKPIRYHTDEAALIGCLHLAPSWVFEAHDSVLAIDIGGTNIRCGVVETHLKDASDFSEAAVWKSTLWRHADDEPSRDDAVKKMIRMLRSLAERADKEGLKLAPFIGVSCPGIINDDGSIERGAQNLPGNWESSRFNLAAELIAGIPELGGHDTAVLMHNDAVAHGLSEVPFMTEVDSWGVLTIGTGLGNAHFVTRPENAKGRKKS